MWKKVAVQQNKLSENVGTRVNAEESASSLQLALENPAVLAKVAEYEEALKDECAERKNVVGVVFVVNGKMTGAEVYGSNALFQKAWPKLLNSAATEALAEKSAKSQATAPSAREVERFLACGGEPQASPAARDGELRRVREGIANDVTEANGEADGRSVELNSHGIESACETPIISGRRTASLGERCCPDASTSRRLNPIDRRPRRDVIAPVGSAIPDGQAVPPVEGQAFQTRRPTQHPRQSPQHQPNGWSGRPRHRVPRSQPRQRHHPQELYQALASREAIARG